MIIPPFRPLWRRYDELPGCDKAKPMTADLGALQQKLDTLNEALAEQMRENNKLRLRLSVLEAELKELAEAATEDEDGRK